MADLNFHIFTNRDNFLGKIVAKINDARSSDIYFSKYSPEPLPISSKFIQAIYKNTKLGGNFFLVTNHKPNATGWLDEIVTLFADLKHSHIYFLNEFPNSPSTPALVIGDTEVFLHLSWPTPKNNSIPYIGIHLSGTDKHIISLSHNIQKVIFSLAKNGIRLL